MMIRCTQFVQRAHVRHGLCSDVDHDDFRRGKVAGFSQLREAAGRIEPQLLEGSAPSTDRHYAHFVTIARGSAKEVKGHLRRALRYELISPAEYQRHWKVFDEIAAMLTGLKRHLERDDWKNRA